MERLIQPFCRIAAVATLGAVAALGQTVTIGGAGYSSSAPIAVAPGQVVTLFVGGIADSLAQPVRAQSSTWPTSLGGIHVTLMQGSQRPVPIFEVRPFTTCSTGAPPPQSACGTLTGITIQIPFELQPICALCERPVFLTQLVVNADGQNATSVDLLPLQDQVHIMTSCDVLVSGGSGRVNNTGLPCQPIVTHADSSLVSAANPAHGAEVLVAYSNGLGLTNPPAVTGQPVGAPYPTVTSFNIDYNFHPNALAAKPTPLPNLRGAPIAAPTLLFSGLTPGFVGLYQINFVVPAIPAGTPACVDPSQVGVGTNFVQSNLTVSFGSPFSFDGAGICVVPAS